MGENFGISRNTLREALRSLASEGLLETRRGVNGGTFVARPDRDVVQAHLEVGIGLLSGAEGITTEEIFETRIILELPAARNAALRRSDNDVARIRDAATEVEHGGAVSRRTTSSVDFHQAVMEAAGNRLMSTIAPPVWRAFASCALERRAQTSIWQDIDHDHAEIADCIEHQDPDGAEAAMRRHLEHLRDHKL
jgi:DNA-binding FadR family transcriptional regulator